MGFFTVKDFSKDSFIEKNSEFIGHISHVSDNDEAVAFIEKIKSQHRKAKHNVYAYILREGNTSRYSDDGEPQGTAGIPVLEVLKKNNLTDVCCVVTRYFGGVLLGGGGLLRAYSHSAKIAVDSAQILNMNECRKITINTDYNMYGKINHTLPEFHVKMINSQFGENVELEMFVKSEICKTFTNKIIDTVNGKATITVNEEIVFEDFAGL